MNHEAIDRQLIELLRMPIRRRTTTRLSAGLNELAAAAGVHAVGMSPIQQEQVKLLAIADSLASELGTTKSSVLLDLTNHEDHAWINPLTLVMHRKTGDYLMGHGRSAQEALRDLHEYTPKSTAA